MDRALPHCFPLFRLFLLLCPTSISVHTYSPLSSEGRGRSTVVYIIRPRMAWHSFSTPYVRLHSQKPTRILTIGQGYIEDSLNQDFELFPTAVKPSARCHGPDALGELSSVNDKAAAARESTGWEHRTYNMISSLQSQETWHAWCQASTTQEMDTHSVSEAQGKASSVDSGNMPSDCIKNYNGSTFEANGDSIPDKTPDYCEVCQSESGKRRYFTNNADRRSDHQPLSLNLDPN